MTFSLKTYKFRNLSKFFVRLHCDLVLEQNSLLSKAVVWLRSRATKMHFQQTKLSNFATRNNDM